MQQNPIHDALNQLQRELEGKATLVAVSKTKPIEALEAAYQQGQRVFGENKVQELQLKQPLMPADTEWHMIGHLQRNKVKYIAPFISLIHGVDSLRLLNEINKQGQKHHRQIPCLLQVHIAQEETKFGFSHDEVTALFAEDWKNQWPHVQLKGLMGMATFSPDPAQIRSEFRELKSLYDQLLAQGIPLDTLSMGMSGDYKIAIEEGSTMVRIGSSIFGARN
jgi:pyridoxal phosphate enzyme (YggS family)